MSQLFRFILIRTCEKMEFPFTGYLKQMKPDHIAVFQYLISHLKQNRGTHFFYQFTLRKYTIMSTDPTAGVAKCKPICSQHLKGIDRASGG